MPKKLQRTASESSDDEAPEAVSFGSSKKSAKGERDAVEQFNASEKLKRKEKNRAIDHALKERSATSKGMGKGKARDLGKNVASSDEEDEEGSDEGGGEGGPSRRDLEARMARAMMEADEEDDEEDGSAFEGFSGEEDVEMEGGEDQSEDDDMVDGKEAFDEDEDEEETEQDVDDEMGAGSEEDEEEDEEVGFPTKLPTSSKRNYLPDHLFKSALSKTSSKGSKIIFDDTSRPSPPPSKQQKRKRTKSSPKDILLGSRTIRTLPKANAIPVKGLSRPRRVEKFARSSINLKGDPLKSRTKGWTRKSANLGVMKRSGPAANFVRNA
ncbi:hypothetical protein L226DRAFT_531358 [Lentinus tigrinus ALCF2SS1-7]|uniref:Uncharacterized protein n=1 Tax=Lentinus tigrinus ALCF2SS1-6 TaxID=1328759 RepID=A0A5C2RZJ7_9APHY|nr:hypothetical protein L227DRAFT_252940 [Lentinus tigrinus ALCF2SS1-6]RPD79596.1 hypothetical protein L226DRAFT_531358 [Lentinus tigrinus ALCF2SS1-7]